MKPHKDLPKEAKMIFEQIVKHLKGKSMPIDYLELSMLSMAYHQYFEAIRNGANEGFLNMYKNGSGTTIQINGYQTQLHQAYSNILKHSSKFGMNPADREKIKAFAETKSEMPDIE